MLSDKGGRRRLPRHLRRESRLWHRPENPNRPLGCQACRERNLCGGLQVSEAIFDCNSFCCGVAAGCTLVCRHNPDYALRVREVGGFGLGTVPRADTLTSPSLPNVVQLIYHAKSLTRWIDAQAVCLSLYRTLTRAGSPKYSSAEEMRDAFRLSPLTAIVLTGTATDAPLERWWALETSGRLAVIRALRTCRIELVGVPNYSLFGNVPRWNDLHAMKRIAIVHHEFVSEGIPAALHINGRTDEDFERWSGYIASREEVTDIAFEFTTGTRHLERRKQYLAWLCSVARNAGRPLNLLLRGGIDSVSDLAPAFGRITVIATNAFMKTTMRRRAVNTPEGGIAWERAPTAKDEALDDLLAANMNADCAALDARRSAAKATRQPR